MTCNCIENFDTILREHNTRLAPSIIIQPGRFVGRPTIATEQIEKGRGKKKAMGVVPTFCPFCGDRYEHEPASPAQALTA